MKKQLFLTALMAVTAFSAQASVASFAIRAGISGLAAADFISHGNLHRDLLDSIREVFVGTMDMAAKLGTETVTPVAYRAAANSSFSRKAALVGALAAATYYTVNKALGKFAEDRLTLPTYTERTPESFLPTTAPLEEINGANVQISYGTPPLDTKVMSLAGEFKELQVAAKKNS